MSLEIFLYFPKTFLRKGRLQFWQSSRKCLAESPKFFAGSSEKLKNCFHLNQCLSSKRSPGGLECSFDNPVNFFLQPQTFFCWKSERDTKFTFSPKKTLLSSKFISGHVECRFGNRCKNSTKSKIFIRSMWRNDE